MARRILAAVGRTARRFWVWLVAAALLGGGAALAAPHLFAWHHLSAGRAAVERFHPDEARPQLDACLAVWPGCIEAHLLAARAARLGGDFATAETHLREAQRLQKAPSEETLLEWAMFHAGGGDLDPDVEDHLRAYIRQNPDGSSAAREALASGYMRVYRVLDALNLIQEWLDAWPNDVEAFALRGDLYWQLGALGKAADDYRRVVEMDPQRREPRERLAVGLIETGRFDEGLKQLLAVRQWKPDDPKLETRLARCYEWVGRTDEARRTLDAVLAAHPDFGPALRQRGQDLIQGGKPAEAEPWLRRAVEAMPQDHAAAYGLSEALEKQGKAGEAEPWRARADKLKDAEDRFTNLTTREMSARPRDPALHCQLGELYLERGSKDLGERWLLSALHLDPNYRRAHQTLARFYKEQGDEEKAEYHRRQAQEDSAPSPPSKGS